MFDRENFNKFSYRFRKPARMSNNNNNNSTCKF